MSGIPWARGSARWHEGSEGDIPVPWRPGECFGPLGPMTRAVLAPDCEAAGVSPDAVWAVMCAAATSAGFPSVTRAIAMARDSDTTRDVVSAKRDDGGRES